MARRKISTRRLLVHFELSVWLASLALRAVPWAYKRHYIVYRSIDVWRIFFLLNDLNLRTSESWFNPLWVQLHSVRIVNVKFIRKTWLTSYNDRIRHVTAPKLFGTVRNVLITLPLNGWNKNFKKKCTVKLREIATVNRNRILYYQRFMQSYWRCKQINNTDTIQLVFNGILLSDALRCSPHCQTWDGTIM